MVNIFQSVEILIDGNNIEKSLHALSGSTNAMLNFHTVVYQLLRGRGSCSWEKQQLVAQKQAK